MFATIVTVENCGARFLVNSFDDPMGRFAAARDVDMKIPYELPNNVFVAPMAGVTDRPFRSVV